MKLTQFVRWIKILGRGRGKETNPEKKGAIHGQ
jgi:hypothetical protein